MKKFAQIRDSLEAGERLSVEDALHLAKSPTPHELCELAMRKREQRFGRKAFYVYNQHINFSNICVNACRFCAFSCRPGDERAYTQSVEDIRLKIRGMAENRATEIHIVGGMNPALEYAYYLDILRAAREEKPHSGIKAFTAVEVAYLADKRGVGEEVILREMIEAGLNMLPGGGAEVFSPSLRAKLCPEKISGERWLLVHEKAHGLGLKTNATMLFGHVESWEERIGHLDELRKLQDRSKGFLCFIPLAYQPGNNPLAAKGPDGVDYLKTIAVSRLFLDNIPHIKAYWAYAGIKAAQMALWAGADDFDGTLVEERIGHAAGADSPSGMTVGELCDCIRAAGFEPVERTADFKEVSGE